MADINNIKEWLEEVLGIETYDADMKEFNEFVDWVTGIDSFTNRSISDGKNISGGSIRQLLQERIKTPIVVWPDDTAGLYRMFTSETAKNRWIQIHNTDPEAAAKLEIFNFEKPSEYVLSTTLQSAALYIIKGEGAAEEAKLRFQVFLKNKENQPKADSLVITYTISNEAKGISESHSEPFGPQYVNSATEWITLDLYKYLTDGVNAVNVHIQGVSVSNGIDVGLTMYLMTFDLTSSFQFNDGISPNDNLEIPFEVTRSVIVNGASLETRAYVDGVLATKPGGGEAKDTTDTAIQKYTGSITVANAFAPSTPQNPHTKHSLRLESVMVTGSNDFKSNTVNYTFEVKASQATFVNRFININISLPYTKTHYDDANNLIIRATQYEPLEFEWSFYSDSISQDSLPITWAFQYLDGEQIKYDNISTATASKKAVNKFRCIPDRAYTELQQPRLVALFNGVEVDSWPMKIQQSSLSVSETPTYALKLNAFGRSNSEPTDSKAHWKDDAHLIDTVFTGVSWDTKSGWVDNAFFTIGEDSYAMVKTKIGNEWVNYKPFPSDFGDTGKTIEIDFKSEQVNDDDDILIDLGLNIKGRITITPTKASVLVGGHEIISTHYKANERIKLAFIFNKQNFGNDSGLIYIMNNGIMERSAEIGTIDNYTDNRDAYFKIGGSQSGVNVYMVRIYNYALTYEQAYNNFVFDSSDRAEIISRNKILDASGNIVYDELAKNIDTILIEGDMTNLLVQGPTKDNVTCDITRFCVADKTKSFVCHNGMARKHGQSTLEYPVVSLKIWFNKSAQADVVPRFEPSDTQKALGLNKNRYVMKNGAIPCNKFVLQANYADSSGANNGSLERLIQDCWYNANFGTYSDPIYRLRTAPQLFASGQVLTHDDAGLNETGEWVEGYYNVDPEDKNYNSQFAGKTWNEIAQKPFPYTIRIAPDSFPCAVFYRNTAPGVDHSEQFLGQYVFMDDKKSDFVYGERSIYWYYDESDPFCLKIENSKQDKGSNKVWDNKDVLRIEVVRLNTNLTSYLNYYVKSANDDPHPGHGGAMVPCDEIKYDENNNPVCFYWEDDVEMIYPDPEDLTIEVDGKKVTEDKFDPNSQFRKKAQPFLDFMHWITDISQNYNQGPKPAGKRVTVAALQEFQRTAHKHLDLYKLAAYYVFFLRFGLVDSVERNAQLKTYDGQHWHYESWDMDIAVGNKNTGGFVFDPPMTRNTTYPDDPNEYAYSGRSSQTSNFLWDCLEEWDYWMQVVVPKVATALYDAGLSYSNVSWIFDEEYSKKWSEVVFNKSEHYKYIDMRKGSAEWLSFLQGSAISHRHWWLSKSMGYYDALWTVGDFLHHTIYLNVTKTASSPGTDIVSIRPTTDTFFKMTTGDDTNLGTVAATKEHPAEFDVSTVQFDGKNQTHIYGANYIDSLDISCFAKKAGLITLGGAYDEVLGAPIKSLNVGIPYTVVSQTERRGYCAGKTGFGIEAGNALGNLKDLDITGQYLCAATFLSSMLYGNNIRTLINLRAMGSGVTEFISSANGNNFNVIELPAVTTLNGVQTKSLMSLRFISSTWQDLSFWNANITRSGGGSSGDEEPNTAVFTKVPVPSSITTIRLEGSTAYENMCSAQLVMDWINNIAAEVKAKYSSLTADEQEEKVLEELHKYTLRAENIRWGTPEAPIQIYLNNPSGHSDLARIAAMNKTLSGYLMIADTTPLSALQMAQIKQMFGDRVFSLDNSGLIIDQNLGEAYVQINIGADAYADTIDGQDVIVLEEGHSATLQATKFLLSDDDTVYSWGHEEYKNGQQFSGPQINITYSDPAEGGDGLHRISIPEGTYGDYVTRVSAWVTGQPQLRKEVDIYVKAVTYPDDWEFRVESRTSGAVVRKFNATANVMAKEFGNGRIYQQDGVTLRDCYLIYDTQQDFEFYVTPINGDGTTATLRNIEYTLYVIEDGGGQYGAYPYTNFAGDGTQSVSLDTVLSTTNSAVKRGIVLGCKGQLPTEFKRYTLAAAITIGGTQIIRYLNLMVALDKIPVIKFGNNVTYNVFATKLGGIQRDIYKNDLLSIDGTLTFPSGQTVNSMVSESVLVGMEVVTYPLLTYMPHLEYLVMDGAAFTLTQSNIAGADKRVLNFSNSRDLKTVSFVGSQVTSIQSTDEYTVDVSDALNLTSFTSTNTTLGIYAKFAQNSGNSLQTVALGSPYEITINNAAGLNSCTVESQTNLTNVDLQNILKDGSLYSFNTFNGIYQTT